MQNRSRAMAYKKDRCLFYIVEVLTPRLLTIAYKRKNAFTLRSFKNALREAMLTIDNMVEKEYAHKKSPTLEDRVGKRFPIPSTKNQKDVSRE